MRNRKDVSQTRKDHLEVIDEIEINVTVSDRWYTDLQALKNVWKVPYKWNKISTTWLSILFVHDLI